MSKHVICFIVVCTANVFAFQQSWHKQYQFPACYEINSICFVDSTTGWAAGWAHAEHIGPAGVILKTTDGGLNWQEQLMDSTYSKFNSITFLDSLQGWAAGMSILYQTFNGGQTWIPISDSLFQFEVELGFRDMQSVSFADSMTGIIVGTESSIAITHNGGASWNCSIVIPENGWIDTLFHGIMLSGQQGCACGHGGIATTSDSGNTWQAKHLEDQYYKKCFFINPQQGWILSNQSQVLYTNNSGETWTDNGFVFEDYYTKAVDIAFIDSLYGYVITNTGTLWFTQDGGKNWESSEISPNISLQSIATTASKKSYVLNKNNALYQNKIHISGVKPNESLKTKSLILYNNSPNPFNPETMIRYQLYEHSKVKINIYNMGGQYICTLIDAFQNQGMHYVSWNSNQYPHISSGTYFYTIRTQNNSQTKSMLLIK